MPNTCYYPRLSGNRAARTIMKAYLPTEPRPCCIVPHMTALVHNPDPLSLPSPTGWLHNLNHDYKYFPSKRSFSDAEADCAALGSSLVSIITDAENDFVSNFAFTEGVVNQVR